MKFLAASTFSLVILDTAKSFILSAISEHYNSLQKSIQDLKPILPLHPFTPSSPHQRPFLSYLIPMPQYLSSSKDNYIIKSNDHSMMMNSPYFTPRSQIIEWINDLLITHITKIEQLGSGNIYCQILDAAYPDQVPLHKVKWHAYLQVDFLHNFKILQVALAKIRVKKPFDAQKLAKAKYQDNLEFIQWMKWHFQTKIKDNGPYNALLRRNQAEINLLFTEQNHFDIKQTTLKNHPYNKDNNNCRPHRHVKMSSSVTLGSQQNTLKSVKSVLGLPTLNSQEMTKSLRKGNFTKKLKQDKENVKPQLCLEGLGSKSKKKQLEVTLKPKLALKEIVQDVQVIQSDEQECF